MKKVLLWLGNLLKPTSLEEVKSLLLSLNKRIELSENISFTVYADNCCQVRRQLKEIFGQDIQVKLDLFHAVQRVSRAMSRQHILYLPCIRDFKMILRNATDRGEKRTMPTPDSDTLNRNIEHFLNTWADAQFDNCNIITPKVAKQIHLLQTHVSRGCLSGIEPGGGTNHNEALHRFINPHFTHAGRIGLPLAYALLTLLLHTHNSKKNGKSTLLDTVSMKLGFYFSSVTAKFGILPSDCKAELCMNAEETTLLASSNTPLLPNQEIERILRNSILSAEMIKNIKRVPGAYSTLSSRLIPFMSSVPSLFFRGSKSGSRTSEDIHERRLLDTLKAWNMCQHKVEGDGNCCFRATVLSLMLNWGTLTNEEKMHFTSRGIVPSTGVENIAAHLRKLAVNEWLSNAAYYQPFLVDSLQVEEEALKFLEPGYFYGDLADTMILSVANALNVPIIVFSSIQCQPVIVIMPRTQLAKVPLMLAYTQFGAGHYDVAMPYIKDMPVQPQTCTCACGRNDKTDHVHCQEISQKYTTVIRCKCLQQKSACTDACRCKNCANPCGKKERIFIKHSRKRFRHEWQNNTQENSAEFAKKRGEEIETGPFLTVEYFVLVNILDVADEYGLDLNATTLLHVYNQVLAVSNKKLNPRSEQDIEVFLNIYKKNLTVFSQLCKNQLQCNLFDIEEETSQSTTS